MPSYADFERDYWAPDREEVLAQMRAQSPSPQMPQIVPTPQGEYANFEANYWAPDRDQVLANMQQQMQQQANQYQFMPGTGYGAMAPYGNAVDWGAIERAWTTGGGRTLDDWRRFIQQNPQIQPYVTGSKGDKLRLPDGTVIDAVYASGMGGQGAQWIREGGGGGHGGGGGFSYGQAPNPTPFVYEAFNRPGEFEHAAWEMPTGVSDANDPGYSARLQEGQKALERSAAARGTLLTGQTAKELDRYAQDYAANEYQNVYNRSLQEYGTNRQNAFQNYQTNWQNALDAYRTNFETKFKPWEANYQQAYNSWLGNYNAAQQDFQNQMARENQRYGQLYGLANLGLGAVGQQAGQLGNYANNLGNLYGGFGQNQGDLITGQGNARAAGQVGSAGAWGNALTGVGNAASMASMYSMLGNQNPTGVVDLSKYWHQP